MSPGRKADSPDYAALRRPANPAAQREADAPEPHPLVALGGQVGNAQVERMLAQRQDAPAEEEEIQAQHDLQREGEEEEELQAQHDLQREGEEEEELQAQHDLQREGEEEEEIQARPEVGLEGGPISAALSGRIDAQRGGGAPLDDGSRTTMEGAFGTSFADVRVHTGAEADGLNRSISAKAFTTGSDIFFRQDASPSDQSLLAHELTHVVQQRGTGGGGGTMRVGPAGDSSEQQADATAAAVTSGAAAQAQREEEQAQARRQLAQREGELEDEETA